MTKSSVEIQRERVLGAGAELFYREPLHIVRGRGAYLYDDTGRQYVDMYNNVPCVGHANQAVVDAMTRQQSTLNVHSRYLHEGIVAFAGRLTGLQHEGIDCAVFSCSGTEAVDVALQMARIATGARGIVCTDSTYHGGSALVSQLSYINLTGLQSDEIKAFPYPELYRPRVSGADEQALCEAYLAKLDEAIGQTKQSGAGFSALILCSILANEGLPQIPAGFMARAVEMAHAAGGLVIADEVQSGYGRTGTWWGYDKVGFRPDIIVTGKPMGNGLPLAATTASKTLVDAFRAQTDYFNTCAASPLQAAVGMAVLDEIERMGLVDHAAEVGAYLKTELGRRQERVASIGDVRGQGLFLAVEMVTDPDSKTPDAARAVRVANALKDKGFLISTDGACNNILKIRPPLVFSRQDAEAFLVALDETLEELGG